MGCCESRPSEAAVSSIKSVKKSGKSSLADSATEMPPGVSWQEQALAKWQVELWAPEGRFQKLLQLEDAGDEQTFLALDRATSRRVLLRLLDHGSPKISEREVLNHRACSHHPGIINFRAVHVTSEHLAIVTEHADLGTVADYLAGQRGNPKFQGQIERRVRPLFQQMILALAFCHAKGVSNRNITLESLLLASPQNGSRLPLVKLWDFGLSKDARLDSTCKTACGTAEYLAPEVLLYTEYDGAKVDMWSAGISLYSMLTGHFCFSSEEDAGLVPAAALQAMFHRILAARFELPRTLSRPCRHLLRGLICPDVDRRLSVQAVLNHPWFLHGLPDGAIEHNHHLAQMPYEALTLSSPQSEAEILGIVQAAKHAPSPDKSQPAPP